MLVTLVAGCAGGVAAVWYDAAHASQNYSSEVWTVALILATFLAFLLVVPAVFAVALPLTLILHKLGAPPLLRDGALLLCGVSVAFILPANAYPGAPDPFWSGLALGLGVALLWILGARWATARA